MFYYTTFATSYLFEVKARSYDELASFTFVTSGASFFIFLHFIFFSCRVFLYVFALHASALRRRCNMFRRRCNTLQRFWLAHFSRRPDSALASAATRCNALQAYSLLATSLSHPFSVIASGSLALFWGACFVSFGILLRLLAHFLFFFDFFVCFGALSFWVFQNPKQQWNFTKKKI